MADSEKIRVLLDQGLTAYGLGNVDEALQAWHSVLDVDPGNDKAKEYIRFVEENWGPRQDRESESALAGEPYRPDEGSGEIAMPEELPEPGQPPEPAGDGAARAESPPAEPGEFGKSAFTPPAKPILRQEGWGDLYDFDKKEPEKTPPSTLPPHPEELEQIEIVEDLEPAGDQEPPGAQPAQSAPPPEPPLAPPPEPPLAPPPAEEAADDSMQRDQLVATRKYDSVPTAVRSPQAVLPPEAVATEPPAEPQEVSRDSLDRFPQEPEPGPGFFQTPPPETTPPLGSPILPNDSGDPLDLVEGGGSIEVAAAVPGIAAVSEVDSLLKGAGDMLQLDDFSGAIELLDKVLEQEPGNSRAKGMRDEAEGELLSMLSSKLGNLNRTPRVRMSQDEIIWLNLDNRAGFILSMVDGSLSLDEIISICGLPQLEGMRILVQLLQEKVIELN